MLVRDSADFYHFRFQRSQRRSYRRARHCSGREIYFGIFKRKISRLNALPQTSRWHFSKRDAAGMAWLPAESASVYHVEIDKEGVGPVYKKWWASIRSICQIRNSNQGIISGMYFLGRKGHEATRRGQQRLLFPQMRPSFPGPTSMISLLGFPGNMPGCSIQEPIYRPFSSPCTTRKRSWKARLRTFQVPTYYKTQDAQQSTSSTASTSAIFADRSTGN